MGHLEKITSLKEYRLEKYQGTSLGNNNRGGVVAKARLTYIDDAKDEHDNIIPTEALYPLSANLSPLISAAFRLLEEAIDKTTEAYDSLKDNELIASDDAMMHVMVILPELFCCKDISEGFGAIVNAIFYGMKNQEQKEALTLDQINMVRFCLTRLQTEPFIEFADAVDIIMGLEDVGLTVEPPHVEHFLDAIDD